MNNNRVRGKNSQTNNLYLRISTYRKRATLKTLVGFDRHRLGHRTDCTPLIVCKSPQVKLASPAEMKPNSQSLKFKTWFETQKTCPPALPKLVQKHFQARFEAMPRHCAKHKNHPEL